MNIGADGGADWFRLDTTEEINPPFFVMKFARIGENAITRHDELSGEELRLYMFIVFEAFLGGGICRKNIREICDKYGIVYNHTTTRFKILRKKGWCAEMRKGIVPLVGMKSSENSDSDLLQKSESDHSKNRSDLLQKTESPTPKIGVSSDDLLQKSELLFKRNKDFLKDQEIRPTLPAEKSGGGSQKNGHLSEFSKEEILRYVSIRQERGEYIENPHGLVAMAHKTGKLDLFIRAILYPEKPELTDEPEQTGEPLSVRMAETLEIAKDCLVSGFDLNDFRKYHSEDEWEWLMNELKENV